MGESRPMNGGNGTYSYTNNCNWQRFAARVVEDAIKEAVMHNLDIETLLSGGSTFAVADLGCSVGPNTFYAVETLIEAVQSNCSRNLEFQVFFNDQICNDFNTLFASLPHRRNYFAAAVAGSFHRRLFPPSSIHIAYSASALHWLSKVPEAVAVKGSPAWNAGRIHYTGASEAVAKAYADQFEEDMENFLRCRAQEIAPGGMIVMHMLGLRNKDVQHRTSIKFYFIESILIDMVKEGVLAQELLDSFNIPIAFPYIEDMRRMIERNGCFETVKLEMVEGMADSEGESVVKHLRAVFEGTMVNHFGNETAEQVFARAMKHKLRVAHMLDSEGETASAHMLFLLLNRK